MHSRCLERITHLIKKDSVKAGLSAVVGGTVGIVSNLSIGGVGLAIGGTAISISMGPFVATGAILATTGYGLFYLGKRIQRGY